MSNLKDKPIYYWNVIDRSYESVKESNFVLQAATKEEAVQKAKCDPNFNHDNGIYVCLCMGTKEKVESGAFIHY